MTSGATFKFGGQSPRLRHNPNLSAFRAIGDQTSKGWQQARMKTVFRFVQHHERWRHLESFNPGRDGTFRVKVLPNHKDKTNPVDVVKRLIDD